MWKAIALPVCLILLVHLYILLRTGHLDPCEAAYSKLEFEALAIFKNKKRWIEEEDEEQAKLYDDIKQRHIVQCYRIVLD